jgi:hypothetical protein
MFQPLKHSMKSNDLQRCRCKCLCRKDLIFDAPQIALFCSLPEIYEFTRIDTNERRSKHRQHVHIHFGKVKITMKGIMTNAGFTVMMGLMVTGCSAHAQPNVPPYPPSAVIKEVGWGSTNTIVRQARDGDNWPVTWASDDALYTTWGDGTGFAPKVERKLSCGFARVTGSPPNFIGENIRSTGEQLGQGRSGLKGWGMVAIGDVLYLWFGHADKQGGAARLAWSEDRARTWTFADWKFDEFGLMGFVNFGRGYGGARDNFVYAYSHGGPRADTPADHFLLMRAPKDRLTKRGAWEFFTGVDGSGQPRWTRDIARRSAVFRHHRACLRSAMTYNSGLRRYLWWQHIPQPPGHPDGGDTRFEGGFGIYDAPEPWGPWTTAYFTTKWDVGPGEHADFPAKWMSGDGRTAWLVFSGDDAFSVRQARFIVGDAN